MWLSISTFRYTYSTCLLDLLALLKRNVSLDTTSMFILAVTSAMWRVYIFRACDLVENFSLVLLFEKWIKHFTKCLLTNCLVWLIVSNIMLHYIVVVSFGNKPSTYIMTKMFLQIPLFWTFNIKHVHNTDWLRSFGI